MRIQRIGTPCRGNDRAAKRRAVRQLAETWPAAHRDSTPARMAKAWRLEEGRVRLVHFIFWAQVAAVARVLCRGPR